MTIFTKEIKIALTAIVGIALLFFGMNFLKGLTVFSSDKDYLIAFDDVSGLSSSSPVYVGGCRVGTVTDIRYDFNAGPVIYTVVALQSDLRIPEGTTAKIVSDMLGNVQVNITLGTSAATIEPGGIITGVMDSGALSQVAALVPAIEQMLPKLDSIVTSLNALLADPALAQTLHNAEATTANLCAGSEQLNAILAQMGDEMPALMTDAKSTLANVDTLTGTLADLDISGTMAHLDATMAHLDAMTAKMSSGDGSLGLLLSDDALYRNLNATMMSADSLLIDLREHPKRYVHFSLFGKKDK